MFSKNNTKNIMLGLLRNRENKNTWNTDIDDKYTALIPGIDNELTHLRNKYEKYIMKSHKGERNESKKVAKLDRGLKYYARASAITGNVVMSFYKTMYKSMNNAHLITVRNEDIDLSCNMKAELSLMKVLYYEAEITKKFCKNDRINADTCIKNMEHLILDFESFGFDDMDFRYMDSILFVAHAQEFREVIGTFKMENVMAFLGAFAAYNTAYISEKAMFKCACIGSVSTIIISKIKPTEASSLAIKDINEFIEQSNKEAEIYIPDIRSRIK